MFVILLVNMLAAIILCLVNFDFIYSFEVAFVGAFGAIFSSYKSIIKKINATLDSTQHLDSPNLAQNTQDSAQKDSKNLADCVLDSQKSTKIDKNANLKDSLNSTNSTNSTDSHDSADFKEQNISKKEQFFLGARISFGIFRLASYAFLAIGCIALINNGVFYIVPFFLGVFLASIASGLGFVLKNKIAIGTKSAKSDRF